MSNQRASFAKREREKQKKERAAAKRERRLERASAEAPDARPDDASANDALIEQIAQLHAAFDDGRIDHETFEEQRDQLMAQLSI